MIKKRVGEWFSPGVDGAVEGSSEAIDGEREPEPTESDGDEREGEEDILNDKVAWLLCQ